jgi:GMP synthase (glutamine-hydrolysing)
MENSIVILDFGSQYTQLIARRIRELGVYSEIYPYNHNLDEIKALNPAGLILSGGPSSVYDEDAPVISKDIFKFGVPVLGICYGMQLISYLLGGKVERSHKREYGRAIFCIEHCCTPLLKGVKNHSVVWMSHGDTVVKLPDGFEVTAATEKDIDGDAGDKGSIAVIENQDKNIYAVQFHPEVAHTEEGTSILSNFLFDICKAEKNWSMQNFIDEEIRILREKCEGKKVVLGVSGGVDSTTLAVLVQRALGDKVMAVFVNNGVLRMDEEKRVLFNLCERLKLKIRYVDASELFLERLHKIENPEEKRKIIGKTFVEVFFSALEKFDFLVQGTLYPDVIESAPVKGPSRTIKTHHNRVSEIEKLEKEGRIIEPFRYLFKDEVRKVAKLLDIPDDILNRHPFPGPGLAVRIIGEITQENLAILREADKIFIDTLKESGWYDKVWQAFCVFLPVKSVGVMGDERAYGNVIALRAVTSVDGMTANRAELPYTLLDEIGNTIIRRIKEVNRVVYDITSKPPATIEWE